MRSRKSSGKPAKKRPARRRTIRYSVLQRLSFCNSKKLPQGVSVDGRRKEWVGIGWIDVGEEEGNEPVVIDG